MDAISNILLGLCAAEMNEDAGDKLRKMKGEVCWSEFKQRACEEGVSALVFFNAERSGVTDIFPEDVLSFVREEYLVNSGRNALIREETEKVFRLLDAEQIPLLVLRGAVLAENIYPASGVRPMIDVDLVIGKDRYPDLKKTLEKRGYKSPGTYPLLFQKGRIYIDVHIDRIGFCRNEEWPGSMDIAEEKMWERSVPLWGFSHIKALPAEIAFLGLCGHLQEHSYSRLIWFCDIAYLLKSAGGAFNWAYVEREAARLNLIRCVNMVIQYVERTRLAGIPREVVKHFGEIPLSGPEKRDLALLLEDRRDKICGELLAFLSITGLNKKIKFLYRTLIPEKGKFPFIGKEPGVRDYFIRAGKIAAQFGRKEIITGVLRGISRGRG